MVTYITAAMRAVEEHGSDSISGIICEMFTADE